MVRAFMVDVCLGLCLTQYTVRERVVRRETKDICSPQGFVICVSMVMSLKGNGLLWLATVCSTWVFICLSVTQRSKIDPLGDTNRACVKTANLMVSRCALIMRLIAAKGGAWVLEQPMSSLMIYHPRLQEMLREGPVFMTTFSMGAHGAPTRKPTKLYSNRPWVADLQKKVPANTKFAKLDIVRHGVNDRGQKTVTGGKQLKATQAYPRNFGKAVSNCFIKNRGPEKIQAKVPPGTTVLERKRFVRLGPTDDPWDDADLKAVCVFLGIRP